MSTAHPGPSEVWADTAAPADIATPSDGQKHSGYTGTPAPVYQYVNYLFNYLFQGVRHLLTRGVPNWSAAEAYAAGDRVQYQDGAWLTYVCIAPTTPGILPTDTDYWTLWGWDEVALENKIAAEIGTLSGVVSTGIATDIGSISEAHTMNFPGTTHKQLSFLLSVTGIDPGFPSAIATITLSGDAAFSTKLKTAVATVHYESGISASAHAQVEITGAQTMKVHILEVSSGGNATASVVLTGN